MTRVIGMGSGETLQEAMSEAKQMAQGTTTTDPPGITGCRWCGMYHAQLCPFVRAIEYGPDGSVTRVEFHDNRLPLTDGGLAHKRSVTFTDEAGYVYEPLSRS